MEWKARYCTERGRLRLARRAGAKESTVGWPPLQNYASGMYPNAVLEETDKDTDRMP